MGKPLGSGVRRSACSMPLVNAGRYLVHWRMCPVNAFGEVGGSLSKPRVRPEQDPPFPHGLFSRPVAVCKNPGRFITGLYRGPDFRRRCGLAMKLDQHVALPFRTSVRTQRAMKSAERRGAM